MGSLLQANSQSYTMKQLRTELLVLGLILMFGDIVNAVKCVMCASYTGSNPACEVGIITPSSGVVSSLCPGSLPWTEGCKVMVFNVARVGEIWTRGCCGGLFPKCQNNTSHFSIGTSCSTDNCNTMNPKTILLR